MLYLALPPTPPPIFATLAPTEVRSSSMRGTSPTKQPLETRNDGTARDAEAQPQACQSDLVSNLLSKILKNSNPAKTSSSTTVANNNCSTAISNKKSTVAVKTKASPVASQENISLPVKQNQSSQSQSSLVESSEQEKAQEKEKSLEKNPIGKILQTVQELISISLYASVNNTISSTIGNNTENTENTANTNNQDSQKIAAANPDDSNSEVSTSKQSNNTDSSELASSSGINTSTQKILAVVQELITASLHASLNNALNDTVKLDKKSEETQIASSQTSTSNNQQIDQKQSLIAALKKSNNSNNNLSTNTNKAGLELAQVPDTPFLVGVLINGKEVGTIDVLIQNNTLFIPLESFARTAGFTLEQNNRFITAKTPLGTINLQPDNLKQINGIVYITKFGLQQQLKIDVELNTADINLLVDLPWRGGGQRSAAVNLKPDVLPPNTAFSTLQQELNVTTYSGQTDIRASTLLGGRLAGGSWRARLENDFQNAPNLSEYFFYKRNGQFLYQIGRQQLGLSPLLDGLSLTGLQFGYTNLPPESFNTSYSANELLPRRSRPVQTFSGSAPPASLIQLRVGGSIVAQQQVGFNGLYEFTDVNLPAGLNNQIEVLIFDRNNLRAPREIRTVRINASDLLLPAGGNTQLAGVGFTGNLVQSSLFGDSRYRLNNEGELAGFYNLRQGLSSNLTFEGGVQALPSSVQAQAGLVWRPVGPAILSASVGSSNDKLGYSADLDIQLDRLQITANSQSLPQRYFSNFRNITELYNHSLEARYSFGNRLDIGFVARSRQTEINSTSYIMPTFSARPFSSLFLSGRPDFEGRYLFNAFFQPNWATRLSFNTYGDTYISDLSYQFAKNYQMSLGGEFSASDLARYTVRVGYTPNDFRAFGWNLGVGFTADGQVGPVAGASMQLLPGLIGRIEYQGIPSRSLSYLGGFGNDRLSISLVSDLSFGGGRVAPGWSASVSKERGAISGQLALARGSKNFDLSGSSIRVFDKRNQMVGAATTDSKGNFMVGNLPEGTYIVELEPDGLPVELSVQKTSLIAQVANSAVTRLDFPLRTEYGLAGRVTDVAGQPVSQVQLELTNPQGARVISAVTDQYGLYRLDGVPTGKYTLRVSPQDELNRNDSLPKRTVEISNEFVYNQNLQLPVSAAAKKK